MDPALQSQLIELAKVTGPAAIAVLGTLSGGFVGHSYAKAQARTSKSIEFVERRIVEFYSPMVGCLKKVRALSGLRLEISEAASVAWRKICESHAKPFLDHERYFEPFKAVIEYNNNQLYEQILPTYDRMVELFTQNYWLASAEVQDQYAELCRFVELWHRFKARSIPGEVIEEIGHDEQRLEPLYKLIQSELAELRAIVAYKQRA
jgi:hypothetical protein